MSPTLRNYWLVARHEYRRMVIRRGFILATVAIPVALALLIGLIVVVEQLGKDNSPVGYVDPAGLLNAAQRAASEDEIAIIAFPDQVAATAALEREEIQAYWVLRADYLQTRQSDLYYLQDEPDGDAWNAFSAFLRRELAEPLPAGTRERVLDGAEIIVQDISNGRTFTDSGALNFVLPVFSALFFMIATMSASGYMLAVVADEKENRTMELMVTSLTPGQLIGGKALGLLAISLTQLAVYVLAGVIAVLVATPFVESLRSLTIPWDYLTVLFLFFFPAYTLLGAIMVALGGAVTQLNEGQQVAGLLNLLFMMPFFFTPLLFNDPGQPAMVALTFFPPSAFITVSLRWGLSSVPFWQLGLSWILLVASAIFMMFAAIRIFRAGMLRYGQPMSFRSVLGALRNE